MAMQEAGTSAGPLSHTVNTKGDDHETCIVDGGDFGSGSGRFRVGRLQGWREKGTKGRLPARSHRQVGSDNLRGLARLRSRETRAQGKHTDLDSGEQAEPWDRNHLWLPSGLL